MIGCCAAAALFAVSNVFASPSGDETSSGAGCIATPNGGSGEFNYTASFTYATHETSGAITYSDAANGVNVSSTELVDYADDANWRGFVYVADGSQGYDEIRVFTVDNGDSGDTFEIQVLSNGWIVYQAGGEVGDCAEPEPEPIPEPEPNPHPEHPEHPDHPAHPDNGNNGNHYGQTRPHGNNGVGNGEDPQPPGNPPINDGPGTGPGNPGNRGGAQR